MLTNGAAMTKWLSVHFYELVKEEVEINLSSFNS